MTASRRPRRPHIAPRAPQNIPIPVGPHIKASEGKAFQIGATSIYVGPRDPTGTAGRNLKRPPVLAYSRPGDDEPHTVAEFPNSSAAEQFMTAMMVGINEARGGFLEQQAEIAPQPGETPDQYVARMAGAINPGVPVTVETEPTEAPTIETETPA